MPNKGLGHVATGHAAMFAKLSRFSKVVPGESFFPACPRGMGDLVTDPQASLHPHVTFDPYLHHLIKPCHFYLKLGVHNSCFKYAINRTHQPGFTTQ